MSVASALQLDLVASRWLIVVLVLLHATLAMVLAASGLAGWLSGSGWLVLLLSGGYCTYHYGGKWSPGFVVQVQRFDDARWRWISAVGAQRELELIGFQCYRYWVVLNFLSIDSFPRRVSLTIPADALEGGQFRRLRSWLVALRDI